MLLLPGHKPTARQQEVKYNIFTVALYISRGSNHVEVGKDDFFYLSGTHLVFFETGPTLFTTSKRKHYGVSFNYLLPGRVQPLLTASSIYIAHALIQIIET